MVHGAWRVQVFHESMKLRMAGRAPDPKLRPQGWPEDLTFPQVPT